MPRREGSSSRLNLVDALLLFPTDVPTLLITLPGSISPAENLSHMRRLRKAILATDPIISGFDHTSEYSLMVVTRGLAHILTTNGHETEETFKKWQPIGEGAALKGGKRKYYPSPYIHHHDDASDDIRNWLAKVWPKISGVSDPCRVDKGDAHCHVPYLSELPLFKDAARQRNWSWWNRPIGTPSTTAVGEAIRLCDRCRKHILAI